MKTNFKSYERYLKYLKHHYFSSNWEKIYKVLNALLNLFIILVSIAVVLLPSILAFTYKVEINLFIGAIGINPSNIFNVALTFYLGTVLCVVISLANQSDPVFRENKLRIFLKVRLVGIVDISLIVMESLIALVSAFLGSFFGFESFVMYSLILIVYSLIFIVVFALFTLGSKNKQCRMILKIKNISVVTQKYNRYFSNFKDSESLRSDLYKKLFSFETISKFKGEQEYISKLSNIIKHNTVDIYDSCEFTNTYIKTVYSMKNFLCYNNLLSFCLLIVGLEENIFPQFNNVELKAYYIDLLNSIHYSLVGIFESKYFKLLIKGVDLKNKTKNVYDEELDTNYLIFSYGNLIVINEIVKRIKNISLNYSFTDWTLDNKIDEIIKKNVDLMSEHYKIVS